MRCHFCDAETTPAEAYLFVNRQLAMTSYHAANPPPEGGPVFKPMDLSPEGLQEAITNPPPINPPLPGHYVPEWVWNCGDTSCPPEEVQFRSYWFPAAQALDPAHHWQQQLEGKLWFTHTRGWEQRLQELREAQ